MDENLKYWIWLNSLQEITARRKYLLVKLFGDPQNIWKASEEKLKAVKNIPEDVISRLVDQKAKRLSEELAEETVKYGIDIVTLNDENYPEMLKNIYDPPVMLYVKGKLEKNELIISVVGSRKASSYGKKMADNIAFDLASVGITVGSGMARGIDSCAHKGALRAGGRTIAVLGCGLDMAYPPENKELMQEIASKGAVISEYPPGVKPLSFNFPARNRIISGMSVGVVVVEAGEHSGSLITANYAAEQGREVFAVPGNVGCINSSGPNKLIKDGAKLVTGIDDILEELKIFTGNNTHRDFNSCNNKNNGMSKAYMILNNLEEDEKKVVECLMSESMHIDRISRMCGMDVQTTGSVLIMLELKGIVEQMPGKVFRLK